MHLADSDHHDDKKEQLAYTRCLNNNDQSNDSVFNNSISKSQSIRYHKRDMNMEYNNFVEAIKERYNKHVVHSIILNDLLPRIKILDKCKDLEYSLKKGTICHFVLKRCHLRYDSN